MIGTKARGSSDRVYQRDLRWARGEESRDRRDRVVRGSGPENEVGLAASVEAIAGVSKLRGGVVGGGASCCGQAHIRLLGKNHQR